MRPILGGTPVRGNKERFFEEEGRIYRESPMGKIKNPGKLYKQLIVPVKHCRKLMTLPHNCPFAGHLGTRKTYERLKRNFYWPDMRWETIAGLVIYVQSSRTCRVSKNSHTALTCDQGGIS